ncbi:MAG: hypothetical protein K8U57_04935 [Planctomycetes bacterium]|nr:hypothetical protein [Planctomycetota bacterium]
MTAARFFRLSATIVGFGFGVAAVTAGQPEKLETQLRAQLIQVNPRQPKVDPKLPGPPGKVLAPGTGGTPEGAVARLGDTRLRHAARPLCVTFSPDSKRAYSGGEDGMLRVWNAANGEAVNTLLSPDGTLRQVRFTHDSRLAVQFADSRVHFLDPESLKESSQFAAEFGTDFACSADGRMIAHYAANGLLRVTELDTKLEKLELTVGSPFQFHPNNKTLAVADEKGVVTLFLLAGGKPLLTFNNGGKVSSLAFSPDGKRVACGVGAVVKVWDIADGKTAKLITEVEESGRVGSWLDNDRLSAGNAESAGVYHLGEKKWTGRARGIAGEWAVSPDGTKLAATGSNGLRIRLWDLTTGMQLHAENDAFPEAALLAPAADGKTVFVLAGDAAFRWSISKTTATAAGKLPGKAVHATTGKDRLAVATAEGVLVYDDFDPTKPLAAKPSRILSENATGCRAIAVSPDGKKIAYSGEAARIVIADAATGKTVRILPAQTIGIALAFSPTGDTLAVIGRDGFLRLSKAEAGETEDLWKVRIQRGQRGTVAFSPDGKLIAASSSGVIKVANASDGTDTFSVGGLFDNGLIQQLAFSVDGRHLIAASEGMTGGVRVWEVSTQALVRRFDTGFGTVYRLGVFADNTRIVSAGSEEAITVWDMKASATAGK